MHFLVEMGDFNGYVRLPESTLLLMSCTCQVLQIHSLSTIHQVRFGSIGHVSNLGFLNTTYAFKIISAMRHHVAICSKRMQFLYKGYYEQAVKYDKVWFQSREAYFFWASSLELLGEWLDVSDRTLVQHLSLSWYSRVGCSGCHLNSCEEHVLGYQLSTENQMLDALENNIGSDFGIGMMEI